MTMVRPCSLITRHRSHIGLTEGRTFISSMPEGDPASGEVVRGQFHLDPITRKDANVVLAHLPGDTSEDRVAVVELHPEHRRRECLDDFAFDLDLLFLDCHFARESTFRLGRYLRRCGRQSRSDSVSTAARAQPAPRRDIVADAF